jgi:acyl-[acyl-carrier-protein] desaturase
MKATKSHRERVYRAYMSFFEHAERHRRWNLFDDIPWEKLDESRNDPRLALGAETFCGVEMYLPDYLSQGINIVRESFGQAWFQANWGYEESKHSLALREYLLRSGQRTEEQFAEFEHAIFSRTWNRPFLTARQMTCYGCIQEATTFLMYRKQGDVAERLKDAVLKTIYDLLARDEAAHAGFYQMELKLELEEDREGTLRDLAHVFANFYMPGMGLVPDYDERIKYMRSAGVDRTVFLRDVWFRLLRQLGTTRQELARHRAVASDPVADPMPTIVIASK